MSVASRPRVAAVVLAAGGSVRMGARKQLLPFEGMSLVRRAVTTALACRAEDVFFVVGASAPEIVADVADLEVQVVSNPAWEDGLGGSIGVGIRAVAEARRGFDGALIALADQARVTAAALDALLDAFESEADPAGAIAASEYAGTLGVPAVFGRRHFDALARLAGDHGAKSLLARMRARVRAVPCELAAIDIDTQADYEALIDPSPR